MSCTPEQLEAARRYRAAHPDRVLTNRKVFNDSHKAERKILDAARYVADKAANNARSRAYYAAHKAEIDARTSAYRRAHPEKVTAYGAATWATHPEKVLAQAAIYRARIRNAPKIERVMRPVVFKRDGGRCHVCGKAVDPVRWHLDHLVPLSLGGEHTYRNVAVAHPRCNQRRSNKGPAQLRLA